MIRINKLTDYGVMILAEMAAEPGEKFTSATLAERLEIPKTTVAKLLKLLTGAGILVSSRGRLGGYQLKMAPARLSMATILTALEGPVAVTECSLGPGICQTENKCRTGKGWQRFNHTLNSELEQLSLASLLAPLEPDKHHPNMITGVP